MPFATLIPTVLAISETDYANIALWAIGCGAAILYAVNAATEIYERFRTKPANSEVFAKKHEMDELRGMVAGIIADKVTRGELRDVHGRIDGINSAIEEGMKDLATQLREDLKEHRKETKDLAQSLEAIHRSIGQIEGKLEARGTRPR